MAEDHRDHKVAETLSFFSGLGFLLLLAILFWIGSGLAILLW